MNKAFLFDMDGVIVDSETTWAKQEAGFLQAQIGETLYNQIKHDLLGASIKEIYHKCTSVGLQLDWHDFTARYEEAAHEVYAKTKLTPGIDDLVELVDTCGFRIGLVSASPRTWIETVLARLRQPELFTTIISLADESDLHPKPAPDGYLAAMTQLGVKPEQTLALEDSNRGVAAAKAAGILTMCLKQHLPKEYVSQGADLYLENLIDLTRLLKTCQVGG